MEIRLDPSSHLPLSAQLRERLAEDVVDGRLLPGERLPPIRELAASLQIAPNTVAKAYRELEEGGLLVGRGRLGTFVADRLPNPPTDRERRLTEAAETFARRARQLSVTPGEAIGALRRAL
jgi:DNA-binding transcriptional regulator YhcF (GntR family)